MSSVISIKDTELEMELKANQPVVYFGHPGVVCQVDVT